MSDLPLPLAPERIPPGTHAWRSSDAERWRAAAPGRWARPLWPFLALSATAVWAVAETPYPVCATATPCAADWPGLAFAVVQVLTLVMLWRHPALSLAGVVVSAASLVLEAAPDGSADPLAAPNVALLLAALYACATLLHRLVCVRQQQLLVLTAAGQARAPLPGPARTFRRGRAPLVLSSLLLAAAVFAWWQAEQVAAGYEERAARATPATMRVVGHADTWTLTLRSEELGTRAVKVAFPEDHPVGSHVDVLVDGGWTGLPAQPYDTFGWELSLLVAAASGLALLAGGLVARRRTERLRSAPLPVLRVLLGTERDGTRTRVYAADDAAGERPLLSLGTRYAFEEERVPEEDTGLADGGYDAGAPDGAWRMREAVLFGTPHTGAELVLLSADEDGGPLTECTVAPARTLPPARAWAAEASGPGRSTAGIVAGLPLSRAPLTWSADEGSRLVGLFFLAIGAGGVWGALEDDVSWRWGLTAVSVLWFAHVAATALNWRVTADSAGLWVCGAWRVRHVPWDAVRAVSHVGDGIRVATSDGDELRLAPTGWSWLDRRSGRRPAAREAAETLGVLIRHPHLRPVGPAAAPGHGLPLGPLLVTAAVLWAAALLFLG